MANADTKRPLLDAESGGGAGIEAKTDDINGQERQQIKLDMWRLMGEARPQAFVLCIATLALFLTAGLQLMIPCVARDMLTGGNFTRLAFCTQSNLWPCCQ